jgi:hypothetical protein
MAARAPLRPPARTQCSACPGRTAPRPADPDQTVLDRAPSRIPAAGPRPATSRCRGCRARRRLAQAQVPSRVPALAPRPATIQCPGGPRRILDPPPASCRSSGLRGRTVAARSSPAPGRARRPATARRSGRVIPGQVSSRVPAAARGPATIRCSAGCGRTDRVSADHRAALPRTVRPRSDWPRSDWPRSDWPRSDWHCRTVRPRSDRPHTGDQPPDRTARPWASRPGRTPPGHSAPVRTGQARTDPVPAVQPRTGPARIRLALAQDLLARIPAGRPDTVAPGRRQSALAAVRARPSQTRTGLPAAAQPRTGRGYHPGRDRAARGPRRWPPTPGRTGIREPAGPAPLPVASQAAAPQAPAPVGLVPAGGSPVPGTPGPADGRDARDPNSPDPDIRAPARRARRGQHPDAGPVRSDTVPAAGRKSPPAAGRAEAPGAADPGRGRLAGGGDRLGAAGGGQRPASRPRDAARAGRSIRDRTPPACPTGAGTRAWAACRAPAGFASARAACPPGGAARGLWRSCSPGSRDQRGRRRLPGTRRVGRRRGPRRWRRWPGRACLGQARCPDDSPGTSWTKRAAFATQVECRAGTTPGRD